MQLHNDHGLISQDPFFPIRAIHDKKELSEFFSSIWFLDYVSYVSPHKQGNSGLVVQKLDLYAIK